DRVANVSPQPDDPMAAPAEVMQPPTLASPRARKAAARTRNVARAKSTRVESPKVRVTRVRRLTARPVVAAPHASTGYAIIVPRVAPAAAPRPKGRSVQVGGS